MSENDKKDFEFIKEQVIEKKRKKIRKRLMPFFMTVCLAVLFGLIAAVTFVLTEPRLYELLHKEQETKTPAAFPSEYPEDGTGAPADNANANSNDQTDKTDNDATTQSLNEASSNKDNKEENKETQPVIVEQKIDASLEDYTKMYDDIRKVTYLAEKSLVTVVGVKEKEDLLFGATMEMEAETTGLIVHNNSVDLLILVSLDRIKDADRIKVRFSDSFSVDASMTDYDEELNLAVIALPLEKIPTTYLSNIQVATLGESYTLLVGEPVIALGSPNGHIDSMDTGIVTSRNSSVYITDNKLELFNTNMSCSENGDGVIVNMDGKVIGLITRTLKDDLSKNLSTAVGISKLKPILENMLNERARVYFGVRTEDMTDEAMAEHEITNGVYVNEVVENSPAFDAGIQAGDIILQINDYEISNTAYFYNTISTYQPGDKLEVKVKRTAGSSDKENSYTVTLTDRNKKEE